MNAYHYGGRLTIDLGALVANWQDLAQRARPGDCAAVVKANAYGLGIEPVTTALWTAGCRTFFVALPQEAFALRKILADAQIYCLGGLTPGGAAHYVVQRIRPVLNTLGEVDAWAEFAGDHPAALHIDTGMTRLGLSLDDAKTLSQDATKVAKLNLTHIMSHLACADEPDHPLNATQIANFSRARAMFPGIPGSLANSAGTLQDALFRHDLARPGIAIYGGRAINTAPNPMRPVISLEARILQVRDAKAGESVGYGAMHTLARASRIAIVGVGYADGYHRLIGNHPDARATINGHATPLLGRISMDLTAIDVTDSVFDSVHAGDLVSLINASHTIDNVADHAQTIGYEILTGLGTRYERIFKGR